MIVTSYLEYDHENKIYIKFSSIFPNLTKIMNTYSNRTDLEHHLSFTDFVIRDKFPTKIDIIISIWIIGLTWHELKQLFKLKIFEYLYSPINVFNFCLNILFITSYCLKFHTMLVVSNKFEQIKTDDFWLKVNTLNATDLEGQKSIFETFYWLNSGLFLYINYYFVFNLKIIKKLDRYYWVSLDPINVSEGFFSIASLFTFIRLCFYLPANQQLGPLEITLGKMINDILNFIFIFSIILASFVFGLNSLYWYYDEEIRKHVEIENEEHSLTKAEESFGRLGNTFMTLFFALYTFGSSSDAMLFPFKNYLTEIVGYILFGTFHVANITIMIK